MIPGNEARVQLCVEVLERGVDVAVAEPATPDPRDDRDRGHFLTPRLHPTPVDPWEPVATHLALDTDPYTDPLPEARGA